MKFYISVNRVYWISVYDNKSFDGEPVKSFKVDLVRHWSEVLNLINRVCEYDVFKAFIISTCDDKPYNSAQYFYDGMCKPRRIK